MNIVITLAVTVLISACCGVDTYHPVRDLEDELLELVEDEFLDIAREEEIGRRHVHEHKDSSDNMAHMDHGGVPMGDPSFDDYKCDDGHTNLEMDWDGSKDDYLCMEESYWPSQRNDQLDWSKEAKQYTLLAPIHVCMDRKIAYDDPIPSSGPHRPLWSVFGEYLYLPPQRWVHNLEHGCVVALYHPCTDPEEVDILRQVVTGCLRKHVITPDNELNKEMPIALVSYTWKLYLPYADVPAIKTFIRDHGLVAPERERDDDGQFSEFLLKKAEVVPGSDIHDSILCPER